MMMNKNCLLLANGGCAALQDIPVIAEADFDRECLAAVQQEKCRIAGFFAAEHTENTYLLTAVLADPEQQKFRVMQTEVSGKFASLTAAWPGFNRFERDIFESCGLLPEGHPNLKPLRFTNEKIGEMDFFAMQGKAVHEVAVGPVHAGVIEPGHFRFECMGETVYNLEISLGYQHRGVEKLLLNGPDKRTMHLIETAAGDSSIAAAWNMCRIIESLGGIKVKNEVNDLRQCALELERCANHIGDLGALAGDVAFLPTASFCGRIRGEYLNMSADLAGNRFGRNFLIPGGVRYGMDAVLAQRIAGKLRTVMPELWNALDLMFNSPTVLDRLENTGTVSKETAEKLGLVGVAARACGLDMDARHELPGGNFEVPERTGVKKFTGDVLSRAAVRYAELKNSHTYLLAALDRLSCRISPAETGEIKLRSNAICVSATEAWRGELCHTVITGNDGKFKLVKITDPSMHNWEGLAMALRDEEISHFPICNKSFNLSYCGHDL